MVVHRSVIFLDPHPYSRRSISSLASISSVQYSCSQWCTRCKGGTASYAMARSTFTFGAGADRDIPKWTSCFIQVHGIHDHYRNCAAMGIVQPNAFLEAKRWGNNECGILMSMPISLRFMSARAPNQRFESTAHQRWGEVLLRAARCRGGSCTTFGHT